MASNRPKRGGARRNILFIIAILFFLSALARLGGGSGSAIAREFESLRSPTEEDYCIPTDGLGALVEALKEREGAARERENAIELRMAALELAEQIYEQNMLKLTEAEEALSNTIAKANSASEDDLSKLTTLYENMKAGEAAPLFEQMEPDFAAGFISRMRPDAAADLLASLTSQSAYAISVVLAGRNASVPTE